MSYTAKSKQSYRQLRLMTQESTFSKGMYYTNKPLKEGYNKTLVNYDINSIDGKLNVRTGIKSQGVFMPSSDIQNKQLGTGYGYNTIIDAKFCDHNNVNSLGHATKKDQLHTIVFNTFDESLYLVSTPTAFTKEETLASALNNKLDTNTYASSEITAIQPISNGRKKLVDTSVYNIPLADNYQIATSSIDKPQIHGQYCMHNGFFKKPISTFAFGDSYYTFCNQEYTATYDDTNKINIEAIYSPTPATSDIYRLYYDVDNSALLIVKYDAATATFKPITTDTIAQLSARNNASISTLLSVSGTTWYVKNYGTGSFLENTATGNPAILNAVTLETLTSIYLAYVKGYTSETLQDHYGESFIINVGDLINTGETNVSPVIYGNVAPITGETYAEYEARITYRSNFRVIIQLLPSTTGEGVVIQQILLGETYPNSPSENEKKLSTTFVPSLHYTKFFTTEDEEDITEQATHVLEEHTSDTGNIYDCAIIPRILTPSEASMWGVNMLSQQPYNFACETTATGVTITGVLSYTSENTLSLNPILNQALTLKCFYNAPLDSTTPYHQYRVVWSWRAVGSSDWIILKDAFAENDGVFTFYEDLYSSGALQPLTCPFTGSAEQTIVKVEIFDVEDAYDTTSGMDIEAVDLTLGTYVDVDKLYQHTGNTSTTYTKGSYYTYNGSAYTLQENVTSLERTASTNTLGLSFVRADSVEYNAIKPAQYSLATAKGMLEWKNRLVLWGVRDAETILWTSEVNAPNYFPYPGNIDILNEKIIHCMPYGDDLIVFTSTNLYRLTLNADGLSWYKTLVQRNLHISENDISTFKIVKNMLFFKSGNYYYMLVPSTTSIAGSTTIAPVSRSIEYLLDNWNTEIEEIIQKVTQNALVKPIDTAPDFSDYLINYYSYTDNASVCVNYVYDLASFLNGAPNFIDTYTHDNLGFNIDLANVHKEVDESRYLVVSLIYDTEAYTWRLKIYHTPHVLFPTHLNALAQTVFSTVLAIDNTEIDSVIYKPYTLQCVARYSDNTDCIIQLISTEEGATEATAKDNYDTPEIDNNQFLDTGYRYLTTSVDYKKRFREFQFTLTNTSQKALNFYTAFLIDGILRKDMQGYIVRMEPDALNPGTGTIVVERPFVNPAIVTPELFIDPNVIITPGTTTLGEDFVLDTTRFPSFDFWKVRVSVSGKGYLPRMQLVSTSAEEYSINSIDWIYRTMNSK